MEQSKACTKCGQIKPFSEFGNHAGHKDGKSSRCLECDRIRRAIYRSRNVEKIKVQQADNYQRNRIKRIEAARVYNLDPDHWAKKLESNKNWRKKNRPLLAYYTRQRRIKLTGVTQYKILPKQLRKLYNQPCIYCGSRDRIEADHVISINRNGIDGIGNLVAACKSCNGSKQELYIMEWRLKKLRQAK